MPRKRKGGNGNHFHAQHVGQKFGVNSSYGSMMKAKSAPYLKKEQVVLTDAIQVPSNATLNHDAQVIRMGPNGMQFLGAAGTAIPQSLQFVQYAQLYEFYQVDGFSCTWIPNKAEMFVGSPDNVFQTLIAGPAYSCLDPEEEFPQTISSILAYNSCKIAMPYKSLHNSIPNYKAISIQKQQVTMLKTNGGAVADIDKYEDTCGFVNYVINPARGTDRSNRYLGWFNFSITYTFSGLKRPGATLVKQPSTVTEKSVVKAIEPASDEAIGLRHAAENPQNVPKNSVVQKKRKVITTEVTDSD